MSKEAVDHPDHYNAWPVECIDIVEHLSFNTGNAVKYLWRAGLKQEGTYLQDLEKALWYLKREQKRIEAIHRSVPTGIVLELVTKSGTPAHKVMGGLLQPSPASWGYSYDIDRAINSLTDVIQTYKRDRLGQRSV